MSTKIKRHERFNIPQRQSCTLAGDGEVGWMAVELTLGDVEDE